MWIYSFSIPALVAKYNAVLSMQFQAMIQKNFLAKRRAWKRFTSGPGGGAIFCYGSRLRPLLIRTYLSVSLLKSSTGKALLVQVYMICACDFVIFFINWCFII